jgi:hypothetical protein
MAVVKFSELDDLPSDPFSNAYWVCYPELYNNNVGRASYASPNEPSACNVGVLTFRLFAYLTHSLKVASLPPLPRATIDVCCASGKRELYPRKCMLADFNADLLRVDFTLRESVEDLELQLGVPGGFSGSIRRLTFSMQE